MIDLGRIIEEDDLEALADLDPHWVDCPDRARVLKWIKEDSGDSIFDRLANYVEATRDLKGYRALMLSTSERVAKLMEIQETSTIKRRPGLKARTEEYEAGKKAINATDARDYETKAKKLAHDLEI